MGTLSKVAAGAASLIPFHCVICFDEFNLSDRVPMVLPCGHTYVCHRCTKRLNRCMECREPLFMSVPSSAFAASSPSAPATAGGQAAGAPGRYSPLSIPPHSHVVGSGGPPPPMVKIPLAVPKNVVLISLMEAAQRQKVEAKEDKSLSTTDAKGTDPPRRRQEDDDDDDDDSSAGSDQQEDDDEDNEEFDLNRIISGMATFSGPCGTYAVTVNHHVVVQRNDPRVHQHEHEQVSGEEKKSEEPSAASAAAATTTTTGAVVVVVAAAGPEADDDEVDARPISLSSSTSSDEESVAVEVLQNEATNDQEPIVLRKGQTVQVVDLSDGVAKLARGRGYIVLGASSHLVKVGGPLDPVCRLEGLLGTIEGRGKDLQTTLDENRLVELSLLHQIQDELKVQPRHPVITDVDDLDDVWRHHDDDGTCESDNDDDEGRGGARGLNKENVLRSTATTPTGSSSEPPTNSSSLGHPRTPDNRRRDSGSHHSLAGSVDSLDSRTARVGVGANIPSQSPMSIDNADLNRGGNAIPVYRRTVSEDDIDQLVFGCGVAILGGGGGDGSASGLFSGVAGAQNLLGPFEASHNPVSSSASTYASSVLAARPRSATGDHHHHHDYYGGPTLTSSFDGIDFRTGMSGHRGLNHLASKSSGASGHHYSPTPRYRNMRLMSEHRGIARPLSSSSTSSRRESPTGTGTGTAAAVGSSVTTPSSSAGTVPAFGPRLSPFPQSHVG